MPLHMDIEITRPLETVKKRISVFCPFCNETLNLIEDHAQLDRLPNSAVLIRVMAYCKQCRYHRVVETHEPFRSATLNYYQRCGNKTHRMISKLAPIEAVDL